MPEKFSLLDMTKFTCEASVSLQNWVHHNQASELWGVG